MSVKTLAAGVAALLLVVAPSVAEAAEKKPSRLRAAAASSDITPPVGTPMFAYTARSGLANPPNLLQILGDPDENLYAKSFVPSEGIHARVRSHALVLERDGKRYALVSVDLGGVPFALTQEVVKRIAGTGIDADRLLVSATHTHSSTGPIWPADSFGYQALGGDIFDPRAFDLTAEGIAEGIRDAAARLEPARMGIATTELRGASRNRNFDPFRRNPDVPADEPGARQASVNPDLTAVRVDRSDGAPIGVWTNFAIHPTNFGDDNLNFSGDNVSTAVRDAEAAIAAERPGGAKPPVAVFANSAEGDISPNGGADNPDGEPLEWTPTAASGANLAGRRVATGIVRAWREAGQSMGDGLPIEARKSYTAFDGDQHESEPVGPMPVLGAGGIVAPDGTCGADVPGQGPKFPLAFGPLVPAGGPVSMWRIGTLGIVGLPSEVTKQMGVRITDALRAEAGAPLSRVALAGLSNGYISYTATPEEYEACHYEGSFTLFGRRQGAAFLAAARPLVGPLIAGGPAPAGDTEPPSLAFSTGPAPTLRATPDAGDAITQPAATVSRHGRVGFKWKGGDPNVDAARGRTFVTLQRRVGSAWRTVGTEDGVNDTTVFDDADDSWTETWQLGTCDPAGRHRFVVTGRAVTASGAQATDYTVTSDEFVLQPVAALETIDAQVSGTTARVRARYPDPGEALLALPRRVRDGVARITLAGGRRVSARPTADRLAFEAKVPAGAGIQSVDVTDGCGNG